MKTVGQYSYVQAKAKRRESVAALKTAAFLADRIIDSTRRIQAQDQAMKEASK